MRRFGFHGIFLFAFLICAWALQAASPVFVSPLKGNDAGACTLAKPCRQFTKALSVVSTRGEIVVLDSGDFQPFKITKNVSIIAPDGVDASITSVSDHAIVINGGASDVVVLRGLTIRGLGSGFSGVVQYTGNVHVESCKIEGLDVGSGVTASGPGKLFVKDTVIRNGNGGGGITVAGPNNFAVIENVRMENNNSGLFVLTGAKVNIRNSVVSGNSVGIFASVDAEVNVENCLVTNNSGAGLVVSAGDRNTAILRISNSTVTDNLTGLQQDPGTFLFSRGNNTVEGNGTDVLGTITPYSAK